MAYKVGDKIHYSLYNTPERVYYGGIKEAVIVEIDFYHIEGNHNRPYLVRRDDGYEIWLKRNEILKEAKNE